MVAPEGTRLLTEGKATIVYSEGRDVFYNNVRVEPPCLRQTLGTRSGASGRVGGCETALRCIVRYRLVVLKCEDTSPLASCDPCDLCLRSVPVPMW